MNVLKRHSRRKKSRNFHDSCIEQEEYKYEKCQKLCPVHNCVREKGLDTCADCGQMDGCPTLGCIAKNSPFVLENLKKLCKVKQRETN